MNKYTSLIISIILLIITFICLIDSLTLGNSIAISISMMLFAISCCMLYNKLDEMTDSNGNFYTPTTDEQFKKECAEHLKLKTTNMDNKQTIQSEINKLKKQQLEQDKLIKELEQKLNEEEDWKKVIENKCRANNNYYFISSYQFNGFNTDYTNNNTNRPPQFKFYKQEHAELMKEKMLLMQEMYAYAHVLNSKFSFAPIYDLTYNGSPLFSIILCNSNDRAKIIKEFQDRINKYYYKQY